MEKPAAFSASGSTTGVDQSLVDRCSSIAYGYAKQTFAHAAVPGLCVEGEDGGYANIVRLGGVRIAMTSDGIGTKVEVAERVGVFDTLGFDLVAMVADDLVAVGAEPFAISNIIDADRLDAATIDAMMRGLAAAARRCGAAITGGEIAALGSRVSGYGKRIHVNWCATALGLVPEGREPISGRTIEPGDAVIALRNTGLRSNGLTLARSVLTRAFGDGWHDVVEAGCRWGELLLMPSVIYAPAVVSVLRSGARVNGIAHVTGGGIPANLGRILVGRGLGARLDRLFAPDAWVAELSRLGDLRAVDAYGQWNMGNGMLLVVPPGEADAVGQVLGEAGVSSRLAGTIARGREISIDASAWGMGSITFPVQ
jgi:phosphoribosylformylglycinamidine cyclo-ligase